MTNLKNVSSLAQCSFNPASERSGDLQEVTLEQLQVPARQRQLCYGLWHQPGPGPHPGHRLRLCPLYHSQVVEDKLPYSPAEANQGQT